MVVERQVSKDDDENKERKILKMSQLGFKEGVHSDDDDEDYNDAGDEGNDSYDVNQVNVCSVLYNC